MKTGRMYSGAGGFFWMQPGDRINIDEPAHWWPFVSRRVIVSAISDNEIVYRPYSLLDFGVDVLRDAWRLLRKPFA